MTMGCVNCRQRVDEQDICLFDGMFVCEDCFDIMTRQEETGEGELH